ncbi:N-acetylglucosamine-1-phosphodiester alpha-N-acetylglucosaminidase [Capsaspora owczarzaki ATCC 30864]|uniref:N-acetylglucosamine-1-phosphodiester alpha-N-acetylglucosaminidase n=1 Tax=Capsaspora owczarzaki (strain ATCC 30864) TaxID=595528 RepID=UPI0001FE3BB4|nr:N-acetylglucosamine-1-phosphodiester alpha-N-acetylglucosaminidase [Capsaspora owczarzaki ATCC 30864]|eukprot:XP_004347995.1 N-acetylglucosamine-1-phosphodiester alpha-N-acetylglucosaminidase [Capsaspora owczarzaki ATCC 30864]
MRPLRRQATRRRTGILLAAAALTIAMLAVASVARVSGAKAAEGGESLLEGAVPVPPPQQPGRVGEQHDLPPYPDAQLDETGHGLHESHPRAQAARRELVRMERERLARRRRRREDNATTAATVEDGDSTADPPLFETFRASVIQGVLPTISYLEDAVPSSGRLVPAHYSVADDPLRTFSIEEPVLGCSNTSNHRELTSVTAKHNQCIIAGNAGFFGVSNGMCHGNLISDGQLVQNTGRQNANFGIRRDGTIVVGYLTSNEIAEIEASDNPFQQLVAGVVWLVRDGEPYIDESSAMEDMSVQETGITFVSVRSGRAALGHDADGRVVLYQVDGKTNVRGVNLYELAELLIKRGVRNAINLDGGGSMTSVLNNQVVSYPSDTCKVDPSTKCERTVTTIVCLHDARCDPVDCSGHGTCRGVSKQNALDGTVGTCDCEFGWRPPSCSVPVDPCVDADYEDYLDWYAATHNNTLPTDNTGGGDAGGGDVPDNDRRRLYFAPDAMCSCFSDPFVGYSIVGHSIVGHSFIAHPLGYPILTHPILTHSIVGHPIHHHTPSSATPSVTPSSHTPSSHTPSSHTPSSATPSVTPSSHTPRATPSYAVGPAKCHINSTCSYAGPGRRTCSCNAGQYGNGTFCQAIPAPCPVYSATPSVTPTDSGSNSFVNPECVPWAYWLTAVAGVALGSIAVSLWLLLTRSKVRRPHPGGPRESNGEALSTKASPPRIRIGSASSGSSSGEADGDITSLSPPSPFLDDELAQASATPGAVMAMTTFVKRVVGSQSKSKSHGAGPPFHKLTGQADTEPLVEDDNDDDDDDDDDVFA